MLFQLVGGVFRASARSFVTAPPVCLNCWKVLQERQVASTFFGPTFGLPSLGSGASDGQDQPILDDGLRGDPGTPGDTSPNQ